MKPIREFKSDEEFQKIAKDLQHKLFLDWVRAVHS